ncbi:hypothetical protein ACFX12_025637 [Malus domestica]
MMWFILRVYTFSRSPTADETEFLLGDKGSDVCHLCRLDDISDCQRPQLVWTVCDGNSVRRSEPPQIGEANGA